MTGWPVIRLADCCDLITKGTTPTTLGYAFSDSGIPFIRVENVGDLDVRIDRDVLFIDEGAHRALHRSHIRPGDVLVSIAGTIGRVSIVRDGAPPMNCNQAVAIVRTKPDFHRPYLRRWLQSYGAQDQMRAGAVTGTISNLSLSLLGSLKVPLPAISEQRRIAEILDKADALRAKRRAVLAQLDNLTQSIFLEMFGDPVTPPVTVSPFPKNHAKGWSWKPLTEVAQLATGHTPDRERADYWRGEIPWISLTDIRDLDGTVAYHTLQHVTEKGIAKSSAVRLPKGTVCFSRTASIGFVTVMGTEMSTSQDFVNWIPSESLDPTYLMWALIRSRPQLRGLSSGSTHKTIYVRIAEQFQVLVPPIQLQREFARRISAIDRAKSLSRTSLAEIEALFASLQRRAFRGQL